MLGLVTLLVSLVPLSVSAAQVVAENACLALRTVLINSFSGNSSNNDDGIKYERNIIQFSSAGGCEGE